MCIRCISCKCTSLEEGFPCTFIVYMHSCGLDQCIGKDEVPGSNPGISSRSLAEMQDFFVVLGWFVQEFARCPSFSETSLLFAPDLSQIVSQIGRFLSFSFHFMRAKMAYHKSYHKEYPACVLQLHCHGRCGMLQ